MAAAAGAQVAGEAIALARTCKRNRVLKLLGSDEGVPKEELEVTSWEQVITRIKQAGAAGQMFNDNPASTGTVHFWCSQVLESMKQQKACEPDRQFSLWQRANSRASS